MLDTSLFKNVNGRKILSYDHDFIRFGKKICSDLNDDKAGRAAIQLYSNMYKLQSNLLSTAGCE